LWQIPRVRKLFIAFAFASGLAAGACHHDPDAVAPTSTSTPPPPLPPSSGTPIGYMLDAATDLKLDSNQLTTLRELDASLAAQEADIDTQLRQIEKPDPDEEVPKGEKPRRRNMAPGVGMHTTADAGKLHSMRDRYDRDALKRAFAVLDPTQQTSARHLLEDHGVTAPGDKPKAALGGSEEDGQPLPDPDGEP
jgi:hypothetical protein